MKKAGFAAAVSSRHVAILLAVVTVVVSVQQYLRPAINNYLIFVSSLKVLLAHGDLYAPHPEYYGDLYKYSPTFPLFMAPLAWQPLLSGLLCWSLINAFALFAAIRALWPDDRRVVATMALLGAELVLSLQQIQSNGLVAAFIVFAYVHLERERHWRAGLAIAAGFFLKGYGAAAALLALVFPSRARVAVTTGVWVVGLALAPLIVLSPGELVRQYASWVSVRGTLDVEGHISVMRVWSRYVGSGVGPAVIQIAGILLLLLPLVRVRAWQDAAFRLRLLCSLLVAVVIFNNSAEPPTYVIAVTGCAIWYMSGPPRTRLGRVAALAILLGVSLISTDLYPKSLRGSFMGPYTGKAMGCLLLWLRINWELLTGRYGVRGAGASPTSGVRSGPPQRIQPSFDDARASGRVVPAVP